MTYVPVIPSSELPDGVSVSIERDGRGIVLYRENGALFALEDRCSHAGAKLSGGKVCDGVIICPLHGARFSMADGRCLNKRQKFSPVVVYPVRDVNDMIEVRLNRENPSAEDSGR
jgi:3-phenylpropionate/trans-cinnamate dioxygenase ferredoxin component